MKLFTSKKERRLWIWTLTLTLTIYFTAGLTQPLAAVLRERGLLEIFFVLGVVLVIAAILAQRIKKRPGWGELGVWLGVAAVYVMLFVRIELPEERTHLVEYGVLAAIIYEALAERSRNGAGMFLPPTIVAVVATALLGVIDECIQFYLPNRVFDIRDVGFNAVAGFLSVAASVALIWVNKRRELRKGRKE